MQTPVHDQMDKTEAGSPEEIQAQQRATLQGMVAGRLRDAQHARQTSGIEEIWIEDEDQYNGYDDLNQPTTGRMFSKDNPRATSKTPGTQSRVFLNITRPKTDTSVSRVQEMYLPTDDKPWEIGPTTVPDLDRAAAGEDPRQIMLADGSQASAQDVAKAVIAEATAGAQLMADQIEDWFIEGSVYSELRHVVRDAGRIGTGVIKGPVPVCRKDRKWSIVNGVSTLAIVERIAPTSKRISAWDVFPDPACGDNIHNGAYIFDRDYLTGRKLRELAAVPSYDKQAIAKCLREGPQRRARTDSKPESEGETLQFISETFEVYYYYGDIPPEDLIAGGWQVEGLIDAGSDDVTRLAEQVNDAMQLTTVPVVITLVNERIVRVSMNPNEAGEFPFDVLPWEPVDGQPWGRGVPRKMAAAQKMLNASTRAMMENGGLCKGPQIVIDKDRITPANGRYEIEGRKLWYWKPGEEVKDVRFAFQAVTIPSAQRELEAIVKFALQMADELSNLPMLMQGIVGSAPDTVGGMQMLEQSASSPLKSIAKLIDDRITVPHLRRYYDYGMGDPNVNQAAKKDLQCKARGSTALVQRDQSAVFLAQSGNLSKDPAFRIAPHKWYEAYARANRFDPASIQYTKDELEALQKQQAENGPPADPRIEAANINAEVKRAAIQATAEAQQQKLAIQQQEAALDRESDLLVKTIEREIQTMEFAAQRDVALEEVRAMLTKSAIEVRSKRELADAEMTFAMTQGEGRGI